MRAITPSIKSHNADNIDLIIAIILKIICLYIQIV